MSTAYKTLSALSTYGNRYINRRVLNDPEDPFYIVNEYQMTMILRRRGEKFDGKWIEETRKVAASEGYPNHDVSLDENGHLKLSFTR